MRLLCENYITLGKMTLKLVLLSCLLALAHSARLPRFGTPLSARIAGGHDAEVGQFPHQISLQWRTDPNGPLSHFCGGSIISEEWILTAGHCVNAVEHDSLLAVKAGKNDIDKYEDNEQTSEVEATYVHEDYAGNVGPFDIALVKLKTPFKFNKYVSPIKLPQRDELTVGQVTLSGWGSISLTTFPEYPSILQTADLSVIELKTCNASILAFADSSPLHETNICTGPLDGGVSACSADSGGPLISKVNGDHELIGVVSWGMIPCGLNGAPSVFVRVSAFIDWIEETISKHH